MRPRPYRLLLLLSLIVYLPVLIHASRFYNDIGHHIEIALALPGDARRVTHVLFHALLLLIHRLLPLVSLPDASVIALLLFMLPVPLIAFSLLKKAANDTVPESLLMAFSLGLTVLSPVTIWTNHYMIGYFNQIVYHNPTMIALRLFLIPVSILVMRIFRCRPFRCTNQRIYLSLLCALLVLMATLAKPSYTLVLIPSCCLIVVWRLLMRREVDFSFLVFGICLPGVSMLAVLYLLAYFDFDDGSTIAVGFLTFMKRWIPTWRIPIQTFLSLLFPLGVYLAFRKEAHQSLYLKLSWLTFGVGAAMAFMLYEEGARINHGNFLWSGYSAVFVLMFASMMLFVECSRLNNHGAAGATPKHLSARFMTRESLVLLLFGLHVISGIAYYFRFLGTPLPT